MKAYLDANVLVRFYLQLDHGAEVNEWMRGSEALQSRPFSISALLRCEVTNAFQRTVFQSREPGPLRVTFEIAAAAQANFDDDLADGTLLRPVRLTLEDLYPHFESLVARHTAKHGFRTYDILHVASALHLGCDTFWSFDAKALKLARLEGLKTNR